MQTDADERECVDVKIRGIDSAGRRRLLFVTRRRRDDARLSALLSVGNREEAAAQITAAFNLLDAGLGAVLSGWMGGGPGGSTPPTDRIHRMLARYFRWIAACQSGGANHHAALDVIARGQSLGATARARRVSRRQITNNLGRALDLFGGA